MVGHEEISLKEHSIIKERHIQDIIADNPKILGFKGDLTPLGKEMRQKDGRRLDLLFKDKNSSKMYEVEIQLGQLDESHLSRAVGYWNVEQKKNPLCEHSAVVIAEKIGDRMLDLIKLLKEDVPIIVIKMTASEKEKGIICLKFERIDLNKSNDTTDDNGDAIKDDKASETASKEVNKIYGFLKEIDRSMKINYTKNYIGFKKEYDDQFVFIELGYSSVEKSTSKQSNEKETKVKVYKESHSFVFIEVQKDGILLKLVLEKSHETEIEIKKRGFNPESYQRKGRAYPIKIYEKDLKDKEDPLRELLQMTYDHNIKN